MFRVQGNDRLIEQHETLAVERIDNILALQFFGLPIAGIARRVAVRTGAPTTQILGRVAGLVGVMHQLGARRRIRGDWHDADTDPDLVLSLNLSAASIADESLAEYILQRFEQTVVKPQQICFEVSESALNHNLASAQGLIKRLQAAGCHFALDNFGSGLASFAAVKNLDIDFIKIDGSLVRGMETDDVDRTMVESINAMAHLLHIRTIAENVDAESSLEGLKAIEVDYAQGYYLGDLVPLDEVGREGQDLRVNEIQIN